MRGGIVNYAGLAICILAVIMLLVAYMKGKKNDYKARKAAKKG